MSMTETIQKELHEAPIQIDFKELYETQKRFESEENSHGLYTLRKLAKGTIFHVPTSNLAFLAEELKRLNRRAARLGTAPITMNVFQTETKEEKIPGWTLDNGEVMEWRTVAREWNYVVVNGETPMLNGWQFVATLVHGENGTIINRVPSFNDEIDLTPYRDSDPSNCDHCGLDRRRNDTFVVYNAKTGETKQIGRQCLKDFLGYNDPMAIARQLERIKEFLGKFSDSDSEEGGWWSHSTPMEYTVDYLAHVACMIRENGWTAASSAGFEETPTSAQAWWNMMDYGKTNKQGQKLYIDLTDADKETAQAAFGWNQAKWSKDGNEFEGNMAVAFAVEFFNPRVKGFVAYGVQAYLKDQTEQIEREIKAENPSEHQGTIGKREVFEHMTVSSERSIDSNFGTTYLYTILDEMGNTFKWFASSSSLKVGETYSLKATVKKHDEYKGEKQTVINRAVIV